MTSKINILVQNLALWVGQFDHFQGQKTRFMGILKVGLEFFKFKGCLGMVLGFKRATFKVFSAGNVDI